MAHARFVSDDVSIPVTRSRQPTTFPESLAIVATIHIRVGLLHRAHWGRRRWTGKCREAMKAVPQVLQFVDRDAEVAIELAEHLLRSRA